MNTLKINSTHLNKKPFTDINELLKYLNLDRDSLPDPAALIKNFPLRVPHSFAERMEKSNPIDPLLLQILPKQAENEENPRFSLDPVGDQKATVKPGILKKYNSRMLLITTGACAIHCRYCFRRNFPYAEANSKHSSWPDRLDYIRQDKSINEIILSGGDPLSLNSAKLAMILRDIDAIEHITKIRIHSRTLIVEPQRLDTQLLETFKQLNSKLIFVTHINHANEINSEVSQVIKLLIQEKILLLNQSVLLKNINDSSQALINLSEKLIENNILPYYLHLLDPVQGAAHFEVNQEQACQLIEAMKNQCSGYMVPKLVREIAGASSKIMIT